MGDYKILESKTVFDGKKVKVFLEKIQLPNGNSAEWEALAYPDFAVGIPITKENEVLFTVEWRQGPRDYLLQLTVGRGSGKEGLKKLKEELNEELGLIGGNFEELITVPNGTRSTGNKTFYVVRGFKSGETNRDENEIQKIINIPIKNLYSTIRKKYLAVGETLLAAKLVEEKYG